MRRRLLQAPVPLLSLGIVWGSLTRVGGTPGALYAAAAILLAGAALQRLRHVRDEDAPLPVRPWNRKARRIQELRAQVEHAISELVERGRTIEDLHRRLEEREADYRALEATHQAYLGALSARLRNHALELESFEQQFQAA